MESINSANSVLNLSKQGNNKQVPEVSVSSSLVIETSSSDQVHHLPITKTESIANHLLSLNSNPADKSDTMTYQGSNAEYIVSKIDGSEIQEKEYLTSAVPILQLQFPRNQLTDSTLSSSDLEKLNHDELNYIEKELNAKGLSAIKIPKTLYDMFYIAFRVNTVAKVLEQGVCCKSFNSLERFLYPSAMIDILYKGCIQNETIHKEFVTIDKEQEVSKVDFELNQYILQYLKKSGFESKKPCQKEVSSLVDGLWANLSKAAEGPLGNTISRLYSGRGLFECRKHHSNQTIFRILRNFKDDNIFNILKQAISQEHTQKASVYTLYRGGDLLNDSEEDKQSRESYKPVHSISYGQSLFSSCELDAGGAGSIPLEYMRGLSGQGYGLIIDKNDFYQGRARNLFVIPPAQRTARFRLNGEFTHARSQVYPVLGKNISGMQYTSLEKAPFIVTKGNFQSTRDFEQALNNYLTDHGNKL